MAIPVWGGVSFTATGRKIREILNYYPGAKGHLYITSSHRPHTPGSHHGGRLSYGGSRTSAVDVGFGYPSGNRSGGKALAQWLLKFQSNLVELIHTPGGFFVKNGRRVGPYAAAAHYDHVHVAMSSAQADRILRQLRGGKVPPASGGGSGSIHSKVRNIKSQQMIVNGAGYKPKLAVDGVWGPKTEAGVKWYQRLKKLTADGIWGKATEAAYKRDSKKNKGSSGGGSSSGDIRTRVRHVQSQQKIVNAQGYTPRIATDNIWGPKTEAAVKWYQRKIGVSADGIWGKATESAHQKYIKGGGSSKGSSSSKLSIDGKMGPKTISALQRALGVKVDGLLGPVTTRALQKKVGAAQDGVWGSETTRKLQNYLNHL